MENKFYVYAYFNPLKAIATEIDDTVFEYQPFYIGKGCGERMHVHMKEAQLLKESVVELKRTNLHKCNTINQILDAGKYPIIVKLFEDLTAADALAEESRLILQLGTRANIEGVKAGPLTNQKISIDGRIVISDETRAKMSASLKGKHLSDEHRRKLSIASRNISDETRAKMSASQTGRTHPQEVREKISKSNKGKKLSEETKEKLVAAWARNPGPRWVPTEESKKKQSESLRGKTCSIETRAKISAAQKGKPRSTPVTDEHREKLSKSLRGKTRTEKARKNMSAAKKGRSKRMWVLIYEDLSPPLITGFFSGWCDENQISYLKLKGTQKTKKFFEGYRVEYLEDYDFTQ